LIFSTSASHIIKAVTAQQLNQAQQALRSGQIERQRDFDASKHSLPTRY